MKIQLLCPNDENCPSATKPYVFEIDAETVMDVNNIATVFCPYCNRAMRSSEKPENMNLKRHGATQ